jgi:hypothetical protein
MIRDAIYDLVARNRYGWFGRRDACILPNFGSFVAIVNRPETAGRWRPALVGCGRHDEGSSVTAIQLSPYHRKHNLPGQLRVRPSSDRSGIA